VAVAEAQWRDAYRIAARDLVDLLIDWQAAARLRDLLTDQMTFAQKNLSAVERRRRAGDAAAMEVNAAEADTAETRRRLSQATSDEQLARINLQLRFPQAVEISPTLGEPAELEESLEDWQTRVLAASDPVRIAALEVERAELTTRRARADWLPDPTLGVFKSAEAFSNERIVGASISIPIPGRYRGHRVSQALSQVDAARAARAAQQQIISAEVARNFIEATGGDQRWRLAEESAAKTRDNADLSQRAYALGEVDLQALLLSRRQSSLAAESALQARVTAIRAYCRLAIDAHQMWSP
jgi:outer membrane protein TolC